MKVARAQQIMKSESKIDVALNGVSVWIDSIDASANTATVHEEQRPDASSVVPIDSLEEK